jgi:hypothetical protein
LTEGWDCPEIGCLILARPTKARFSEVCGAVDNEISAFTAAVGDDACAQLSCALTR